MNPAAKSISARTAAWRIVAAYASVGALWILVSEWALHHLVQDGFWKVMLGTAKDWLYLLGTAAVLGWWLRRHFREIRAATEQIRQSEARLRTLGDNLPDAVVYQRWVAPDGRHGYRHMSAGIERILGVPAAKVLADPAAFMELVVEEDRARLAAAELQSARDLTIFDCDFRQRTVTGVVKWIHAHSTPQRLADGSTVWDGAATDITARKLAEAALRESEIRNALALDAAKAGIWEWELASGKNSWSEELWKLYDIAPHSCEPSYQAWRQSVHPDDRIHVDETLQNTVQQEAEISMEWRVNLAAGGIRWLLSRGRPLRDESGRVARYLGVVIDITERKHAEESARQNAQRLNFALQASGTGAWDMNLKDRTATRTLIHARIFGYPTADGDWSTKKFLDHVIPDDREEVRQIVESGIAAKSGWSFECRIRRTDGEVRWVLIAGGFEADGADGRVSGIIRDITDRKLLEASVRESERKYTILFEKSTTPTILLRLPEAVIADANEACELLTGYTRQELAGKTAVELGLIKSDSRAEARSRFERQGALRGFEVRLQTKSGAERIVVTGTNPVTIGEQMYAITTIQDMTDRRRAEENLKRNEQLLRLFVEHSPAAIAMFDREMRYVVASRRYVKDFGLGTQELAGRSHYEVFPEMDEVRKEIHQRCLRGEVARCEEDPMPRANGTLDYVRYELRPWYEADDSIGGLIFFSEVITERKRLEQQRAAMETQLRQQQKLESIGTLASGVAHEINNPITGIMNYAQLIQDRLPSGSPLAEFAGEIMHETERVATIVRNLLTFARNEKQSHSLARIADIIEGVLSLLRTVIRRDQITLQVDLPDDLPPLKCRSQQIQQVIMNLVTNARDALNERYSGHDPDKILRLEARLLEKAGRRWIRITVEDHGAGIAPGVRERMFDPFFTTKPRNQGTGLGLSISHGIVKEHHGDWLVESEPGRGTRMNVDLPVDNGWKV